METRQNILLIRLRSMGDVLFTLPAVHLVREVLPSAKIAFLVSRENAPLLEGFRDVDETISVGRARYRRGNPISICLETPSLLRALRRGTVSPVGASTAPPGKTGRSNGTSRSPSTGGNAGSKSSSAAVLPNAPRWSRPDKPALQSPPGCP